MHKSAYTLLQHHLKLSVLSNGLLFQARINLISYTWHQIYHIRTSSHSRSPQIRTIWLTKYLQKSETLVARDSYVRIVCASSSKHAYSSHLRQPVSLQLSPICEFPSLAIRPMLHLLICLSLRPRQRNVMKYRSPSLLTQTRDRTCWMIPYRTLAAGLLLIVYSLVRSLLIITTVILLTTQPAGHPNP